MADTPEYLKLRNPELFGEVDPIIVGDGMSVISLDDFVLLQADQGFAYELGIDAHSGITMPAEWYTDETIRLASSSAPLTVAERLNDLYRESGLIGRGNPDFKLLVSAVQAKKVLIQRLGYEPSLGPQSAVIIDTGRSLLGLGIVNPGTAIKPVETRVGRKNIVSEAITEGTLIRGFVKRHSRELGELMARGLIEVAQASDDGMPVLIAATNHGDNGVATKLLEFTEPIDVDTDSKTAGFVGSATIVPPKRRQVWQVPTDKAA